MHLIVSTGQERSVSRVYGPLVLNRHGCDHLATFFSFPSHHHGVTFLPAVLQDGWSWRERCDDEPQKFIDLRQTSNNLFLV